MFTSQRIWWRKTAAEVTDVKFLYNKYVARSSILNENKNKAFIFRATWYISSAFHHKRFKEAIFYNIIH